MLAKDWISIFLYCSVPLMVPMLSRYYRGNKKLRKKIDLAVGYLEAKLGSFHNKPG